MAIPVAHKHKRGNPNWGVPFRPIAALPTEFELKARELHLTARMYSSSRQLHVWCERNRNRVYIPEWLLEEWGMLVNLNFGHAA
jgi:hypothetical protein